jgi:phosphoribosylformylglycinamidine synthase PurS subunit
VKAKVYVTLKTEVLDPQGDAVRRALHALGHDDVKKVRVGKLVEIELDEGDRAKASSELQEMCAKLLANPVIEDFRFELE